MAKFAPWLKFEPMESKKAFRYGNPNSSADFNNRNRIKLAVRKKIRNLRRCKYVGRRISTYEVDDETTV